MAFDQNSVPKDLRPINITRNVSDETRIAPQPPTTSGWAPDGFYSNAGPPRSDVTSPPSGAVYYTDAAGYPGGAGFGNPGGPHLGQAPGPGWASRMMAPPSTSVSSAGYAGSPSFSTRVSGGAPSVASDQASEDGGDDSVSGRKVKFLCSFGGKILPRPSDGMLRYVGGQTRIISVRKEVTFEELFQKMADTYGQHVVVKYQLPDEDLDALVSVACPDDLDNMMEEYEKLQERSSDGSAKLRVFLFSASEFDSSTLMQMGNMQDTGQRYVDAVNGVAEGIVGGITRKESIASVTSTQNSDMSGTEAFDPFAGQDVMGPPSTSMFSPRSDSADNAPRMETSVPPFIVPSSAPSSHLASSQPDSELDRTFPLQVPVQQQQLAYELQQPSMNFPPPPSPYMGAYVDPHRDNLNRAEYHQHPSQVVYANPQVLGAPRPILIQPQLRDNAPLGQQQYISAVPAMHMTMAPPSSHLSVNPNMVQPLGQPQRVVAIPAEQSYRNAYPNQMGGGYGWPQVTQQDHVAFSEGWMQHPHVYPRTADCIMCQKALPHAHSDTVVQDQKETQPSAVSGINPVYHSLRLDDVMRMNALAQHNQGMMGYTGDAHTPYVAVRGNVPTSGAEDVLQQHLIPSSQATGAVLREDAVRSATSQELVKPLDLMMENLQVSTSEIPLKSEQGKSPGEQHKKDDNFESMQPQTLGREALPNFAFSRPAPVQEIDQTRPSEVLPCSLAEVSYQNNVRPMEPFDTAQSPILSNFVPSSQPNPGVNLFEGNPLYSGNDSGYGADRTSPGSDPRDDAARFQAAVPSGPDMVTSYSNVPSSNAPNNWGNIMNDSGNSLFSNQDPWNMRNDAHFPPPKPSKIALKRDASAAKEVHADNRLGHNGESSAEAHVADGHRPTPDLVTGQGSAEERIKQQLQATAEGVAASVLHSPVPSNTDFLSHGADISASEPGNELEGQSNSDAAIQTKMEAMNIKAENTNIGFPLSDGMGRLQIIKNSDLEELRELGSGTFGTVYHGKWRGTDVAIKRINDRCFAGKTSEQERMRDDFWNEAIKLADLHHPNVVAFYGVVLDGPGGSIATVTEYMVNGSLRTALQKNERNLDKRKRHLIAMDVAFGMEYLHSKNIVHFDLKSDNLLVNLRDPHRPICKVGDLGLSKVKCQTLISGGVRGTLPWMAPELLNGSSSLVSEKVDVFSFGIVLWELLTGEEPYADLHYGAIIGGIVSNTLRPAVPENCDPEWKSLMERCWSAEPSERPNFTEIANELRSMAAKIPSKTQAQPTNTRTNA